MMSAESDIEALTLRIDKQDERIRMLENYDVDHHENIRKLLETAAHLSHSLEFVLHKIDKCMRKEEPK